MGKTQSKRSVDITTETNKGVDDEITEKMEKIEDVDNKDINGDATVQSHSENKDDNDDTENDKDITTEKNLDIQASVDNTEDVKPPTTESKKEDGSSEEISPLSDENVNKKSKKEKLKKKWSFRSISFGKKDKQKPCKNEDNSEQISATINGTDEEKTSPETEESQKEKESADNVPEVTSNVIYENSNTIEPEMNGQNPAEEKSSGEKRNEETANTNQQTTKNNDFSKNDTATITSQETEQTSNITSKSELSDANVKENREETPKIGITDEEVNRTEEQHATSNESSAELTAEKKNIPAEVKTESISVNGTVDEIHQNGTNDVCDRKDEQPKAQIEVNIISENKAYADSIEIISSSTSNNPSNAPVNFKNSVGALDDVGVENDDAQKQGSRDLNESGKKLDIVICCDNKIEIDNTEVDVLMDEKLVDEHSPPPLPISPPPSHVTVFAFTHNDEPVDNPIEKSEPINAHEEDTVRDVSLQMPASSDSEINYVNESSKTTDSICLNEEISDKENTDETKTENNEDLAVPPNANKLSSITLECVENGNTEVKECEVTTPTGSSHSAGDNFVNGESIEMNKVGNQYDIETSLNSNISGENQNPHAAKELYMQSQDNYQASANVDSINLMQQNTSNSPESLSSIILSKNDGDNDCLLLENANETAYGDDKSISNKVDSLVREETKEFASSKDIKESATVADVTEDSSVICE